jgi:PAT family beta-lactamase induction signal transducer AmpG
MRRYGRKAMPILALICLYRLSDFLLNIMNPFYLDLGFSLAEVAEVRKIFGVAALMAGVFAGGYAIARFGMSRSLVVGAVGGPLSNLVFVWPAGQDQPGLDRAGRRGARSSGRRPARRDARRDGSEAVL